jgi:hypothetical protein
MLLAPGCPVSYRPGPGIAIYHVSVDHYAVMIAEHDLAVASRLENIPEPAERVTETAGVKA